MNPALFKSAAAGRLPAPTNTTNDAGGRAYEKSPEAALALYSLVGTMNDTFYCNAETHLDRVAALCAQVEPVFIAKLAILARERGFMKDLPAYLLAHLAKRDVVQMKWAFPRVIDNAKMLRNFVQIVRSGVIGRKSLGTRPKKAVLEWLGTKTPAQLFRQSTGDKPSLADVVKMVHPKPKNAEEAAFYGWLIGKKHNVGELPAIVRAFEEYKASPTSDVPDVPFEMLTNLPLSKEAWTAIAKRATWTQTRMNLNTFMRHGVFEDASMIAMLATRLGDPEQVRRARVFPYQLFNAFKNVSNDVPMAIKLALQQAMEIAIENVPSLEGNVYVLLDVSGSMSSPITGARKGATSNVKCIDVASLIAAAVLRKNPKANIIPFAENVITQSRLNALNFNPLDTVMTNAQKLASLGGGGTNCASALAAINFHKFPVDLAIFVSDSESWISNRQTGPYGRSRTASDVMVEWEKIKARSPQAKLACIDIQPNLTTQVESGRAGTMNIGGFSDQVFEILNLFTKGELEGDALVKLVKEVA